MTEGAGESGRPRADEPGAQPGTSPADQRSLAEWTDLAAASHYLHDLATTAAPAGEDEAMAAVLDAVGDGGGDPHRLRDVVALALAYAIRAGDEIAIKALQRAVGELRKPPGGTSPG